jgi:hypothetical protein
VHGINNVFALQTQDSKCRISDSESNADEYSALVEYDAFSVGKQLPMVQRSILFLSSECKWSSMRGCTRKIHILYG